MMNNSTIEALKAMRFSAMAAEFERQLDDPAAYSHLGFEERFALMVDAEWNRRQQNRLARCIREAHFATPAAMIEDIEYHEDRRLDKSQILRFATCKYIEDGHHIILKGASGSGKTFLACALGNAACRKYKSVRYIRLPELLEELSLAQASGELKKLIKSYRKYDLLILDDLGTEYISQLTISVLYELINTRMLCHRPTIYTSNIVDSSIFEARYTEKVASRILGSCQIFKFFGTDQRLKRGSKR